MAFRDPAMHFIQLSDGMLNGDSRLMDFLLLAARESDRRFFDLIRENVRDHEKVALRLILDDRSDLHGGLLAIDPSNGSFAGLMVSKPLREVSLLQFHSLREYSKAAVDPGKFRMAIKVFASRKMPSPREHVHYLARLYIAKDYRGLGLSKQLISLMFMEGQKMGANTFGLHVDASNLQAINLYRRTGFALKAIVSPDNDYFYLERRGSQAISSDVE